MRRAGWAGLVLASACGPAARDAQSALPSSNVLVIVLDDVGCDAVGTYGEHPRAPATPALDELARTGVLFRRAYANTVCTPTRASLLTGRYAFRTGLGRPIGDNRRQWSLREEELTIPEVLALGGRDVASFAIGKWHVCGLTPEYYDHPRRQGFDHFSGLLENLDGDETYTWYEKIVDGVPVHGTQYLTSAQVDDALAAISAAREPWFGYVASTAAHDPWNEPPPELTKRATQMGPARYRAIVSALDLEIGRLLRSIAPEVRARTTILLLGDNGTPNEALLPPSPPDRGKSTLFEGGIRVPFLVSGAGVASPGRECGALVHVVDVLPTVAELFGVELASAVPRERTIDGRSLVPLLSDPAAPPPHEYVLTDQFGPNGPGPYTFDRHTIRDARWKLMVEQGKRDALFDLGEQRFEGQDLLPQALDADAQRAYERLKAELMRTLGR